jgi:hypothetical protein
MREWRYSFTIPKLGTRWRWSASRYGRFIPRYHLDRRLGGLPEPVWTPEGLEQGEQDNEGNVAEQML